MSVLSCVFLCFFSKIGFFCGFFFKMFVFLCFCVFLFSVFWWIFVHVLNFWDLVFESVLVLCICSVLLLHVDGSNVFHAIGK